MIRSRIVRDYSKYARAYGFDGTDHDTAIARLSLKEQIRTNAIRDNGIFKTFSFSDKCYDIILDYIKIEDEDIGNIPDMFEKRWYFRDIYSCNNPPTGQGLYTPYSSMEFQDIMSSCLLYNETNEIDDTLTIEFEKIKKECVEKYNAVYSSVNIVNIVINKERELITINYRYHYIKDDFIDKMSSYDVIFGKAPLPYGEWFSSDSQSTDESEKESNIPAPAKAIYKSLKNKEYINYVDCTPPAPATNAIRYCSSDAMINELLLKENKNMTMIVHLLIVPEGMSEEFVNNTKKNLQRDDDTALYVSSNDIAFEPNDRYKTKYDLLEQWVKSGKIHCVEFMVGYENDPEAKAFESFIRGIRTNSTSSDTVTFWYQKDTIERKIRDLRNDYVESSKARERLDNITDRIMDKVKYFEDYVLDDDDLDEIRNANRDKDAYDTAIYEITEMAFSSDKKGNKKK